MLLVSLVVHLMLPAFRNQNIVAVVFHTSSIPPLKSPVLGKFSQDSRIVRRILHDELKSR